MKDEIKEVLEDVKRHLDYVEATKQCSIRDNEMKVMCDYITTLQEKNEKLKEECRQWKENHKAVCIQRDNILDKIVKDTEEEIDYKKRIDKAIDKLNEQIAFTSSYQLNYQSAMYIIEEAKKILLQGDDNNVKDKR